MSLLFVTSKSKLEKGDDSQLKVVPNVTTWRTHQLQPSTTNCENVGDEKVLDVVSGAPRLGPTGKLSVLSHIETRHLLRLGGWAWVPG